MVRFSKRCSREEDFVAATTRMTSEMIAKGYDARKIKSKMYKFAAEIPHLFYRNGAKAWSRNIIGLIDDQRPRTSTREAMMEGWGFRRSSGGRLDDCCKTSPTRTNDVPRYSDFEN